MSHQRRRGPLVSIWQARPVTDNRGNVSYTVDLTSEPLRVRAAFIPQRSARAEVPGQQQINVTRMICEADLSEVNIWSRVLWEGRYWDFVTPPNLHIGTRHTRHWSVDLRERP